MGCGLKIKIPVTISTPPLSLPPPPPKQQFNSKTREQLIDSHREGEPTNELPLSQPLPHHHNVEQNTDQHRHIKYLHCCFLEIINEASLLRKNTVFSPVLCSGMFVSSILKYVKISRLLPPWEVKNTFFVFSFLVIILSDFLLHHLIKAFVFCPSSRPIPFSLVTSSVASSRFWFWCVGPELWRPGPLGGTEAAAGNGQQQPGANGD